MPASMAELLARDWQDMLPPVLWSIGVVAVTLGAMGYASWRMLLRMPEFPEKAAMLRGAKWGAPVFIGLLAVYSGVVLLGARCGLIVAEIGLGRAVLWSGTAILLIRFRLECDGLLAWPQYWLRYRRQGAERWIEDWREKQPKAHRQSRVLAYLFSGLVLLWLGVAAWGYWRFDRAFIAMAADERFGLALQRELGDARVVEVMPTNATFEGPLLPLFVYVTPHTDAETGRRLAERLAQILASRPGRNAWRIEVRPKHGHIIAKRLYVPRELTLPPGIEKRHLRPRDW